MAGKNLFSRTHRSVSSSSSFLSPVASVAFLSVLSLLAFLYLFPFSSLHQSPESSFSSAGSLLRNPNPTFADTSFLVSLEKFLHDSRPPSDRIDSSDGGAAAEAEAKALDDRIWRREMAGLYEDPVASPVLRVYVYNMPSKFTYDLLLLFWNTYKETDNLTSNGSPVHRLIEQHSVDYWLWADLIASESKRLLKNVIRVHRQEEADLFYIPFFTTISYFLLEKQECKALYRVWAHFQGGSEVGDRSACLEQI